MKQLTVHGTGEKITIWQERFLPYSNITRQMSVLMFQVNYNTFLPTWTQPNFGGFPLMTPILPLTSRWASKMCRGTFRRTMRKRLPPNGSGHQTCHMASLEVIEVLILQDGCCIFVKNILFIQNRNMKIRCFHVQKISCLHSGAPPF